MALKFFLQKSPELNSFLSEKEQEILQKTPYPETLPESDEPLLEEVHWSWFLPTIKAHNKEEQRLFLGALSPSTAKSLASALDLLKGEPEVPEAGRAFFRQILLDSLIRRRDPPLPLELLPTTPLKQLLLLSKKELVDLINKLALADLAEELRQIVDTKILKKIQGFLSGAEMKLIKKAAAYRETFSFGKLPLDRWDGSEEGLRTLLHKRGLMRLGAAVSEQSPDFLWHLCHRLDIGRGSALFKLATKPFPKPVQESLLRQIERHL